MEIIKIVIKYIVLILCCLIQIIEVALEGISKFFEKLSDYLDYLHKIIFGLVNRKDRIHKQTTEDR